MTDWSKAIEVFVSGIIGVYVIMFLLMVMTQLGLKIVDMIENWNKVRMAAAEAAAAVVKGKEGQNA